MRSSDNEVTIVRGETFCLGFNVVNKDGSPYVIPKITDPRVLIRLSDSRYEKAGRFLERRFLPLDTVTFLNTKIIPLKDIKDGDGKSLYLDFPNDLEIPFGTADEDVYIKGYYNDVYCGFQYGDCVHSVEKDGKMYYKYAFKSHGGYVIWRDYYFNFVATFLTTDTDNWPDNLFYSIYLVSGENETDYKVPLLDAHSIIVKSK